MGATLGTVAAGWFGVSVFSVRIGCALREGHMFSVQAGLMREIRVLQDRRHLFLALMLVAGALLSPGRTMASEVTVIPWSFRLPFWEMPDRQGQFGGYSSGSFEIVVDGGSISVRNFHALGFVFEESSGGTPGDPGGWYQTTASQGAVGVSFVGPLDYCNPYVGCIYQYDGGLLLTVDGDLTKPGARLPVTGGSFSFTEGHYSWWYGYFAAGDDSFVVGEVPEPASWIMMLAGLTVTLAGARLGRRGVQEPPCGR